MPLRMRPPARLARLHAHTASPSGNAAPPSAEKVPRLADLPPFYAHAIRHLPIDIDAFDPFAIPEVSFLETRGEGEGTSCSTAGGGAWPPPIIGPPRCARSLIPSIPRGLTVKRLPHDIRAILTSQLMINSFSSFSNWQHVAACMGMSQDAIMSKMRRGLMADAVLDVLAARPLRELIECFAVIRRVDLLYTLRPLLAAWIAQLDDGGGGGADDADASATLDSFDSGMFNGSDMEERLARRDGALPAMIPRGPFILVVHHEVHAVEKSDFRWFWKNCHTAAATADLGIVDVKRLLNDAGNIFRDLQEVYQRADQVFLALSESYRACVAERNGDDAVDQTELVLRWLYDQMEREYVENGASNARFRLILLGDNFDPKSIPLGWASSTLYYYFPKDWKAFSRKHIRMSNQYHR